MQIEGTNPPGINRSTGKWPVGSIYIHIYILIYGSRYTRRSVVRRSRRISSARRRVTEERSAREEEEMYVIHGINMYTCIPLCIPIKLYIVRKEMWETQKSALPSATNVGERAILGLNYVQSHIYYLYLPHLPNRSNWSLARIWSAYIV